MEPRSFLQKTRFLDILAFFWLDFDQISFNLVKHASVTRQLAALATSIAFYDILPRAWAEILGFSIFEFFFPLSFFSFSFLFAAVIDLLLGLLVVKKLLQKRHRDGQILRWNSQVQWHEILRQVFHSTFWAFLCISRAPLGQSPWSGHHWKDVFLLPELSIDDAIFGQEEWRQKWKKGRGSPRPVTAGTRVNGLNLSHYFVSTGDTHESIWYVTVRIRILLCWDVEEKGLQFANLFGSKNRLNVRNMIARFNLTPCS